MKQVVVAGAVLMSTLVAGNALAATNQVRAAAPESTGVSAFAGYTNLSLSDEGDIGDFNGHSLGARVVYGSKGWFAKAEYLQDVTSAHYDGLSVGLNVQQVRVGGGYGVEVLKGVNVYGEVNYVYASAALSVFGERDKGNNRGYFFGSGVSAELLPNLTTYARIGYLTLDGNETDGNIGSGMDYLFGAGYAVLPQVSVFVEGATSNIGEQGAGLRTLNPRAGVKYSF
jgi:hypothetical protein